MFYCFTCSHTFEVLNWFWCKIFFSPPQLQYTKTKFSCYVNATLEIKKWEPQVHYNS
jgi:hypothetical protein